MSGELTSGINRLVVLAVVLVAFSVIVPFWPSAGSADAPGPKAHETTLSCGQEFHSGSMAPFRCGVHSVKSITEATPIAGAEVVVELRDKNEKIHLLHRGKTGSDGWDSTELVIPQLPAGQYTLAVTTRSDKGQEKLDRNVRVKGGAKVLLVTDKPLYQPGQLMHIRALTLRPFDLKPVANENLTFEVEDPKGNKVFKRTQKTSEYGIAAIDFQLADEVNMGDYHVRANIGETQADKTVTVKRYVLPKFKATITADKSFYLPKETINAEVQSDYFFGKPVAGGSIEVKASTFDVQFREFQTWKGKTDANGHAKFEIKLPDYFVGQPLQKGNALVKLEVKVTDTADHAETINKTYSVSDQPIRVNLIPEGGRLVPDMENRVFVAATYPDGTPAVCDVAVFQSSKPAENGNPRGRGKAKQDVNKDEKAVANLKTNVAGLAEFRVTPKADQFRQGEWAERNIEMFGGQNMPSWMPKLILDYRIEAKDAKGDAATATVALNGDSVGENVILRLDKAIYRTGDSMNVDVRSSAGLPTAYLDVVRNGQTLLTRWLDVKDGKASYKLDLPAELFGTVEVHAYQMLQHGEIVRDSRVVYVQSRDDLKIKVEADKDTYLPGAEGKIRFEITDASGKPAPAALGIIIVDESVYALQEMQPGLEKVYFTLQEELLKPKTQVIFNPAQPIDVIIQDPAPAANQQQVVEVLLTAIKPKPPKRWDVNPALDRRRKVEEQVQQIGWTVFNYATQHADFMRFDKAGKRWEFKHNLLDEIVKQKQMTPEMLKDPFGKKWTLDDLAKLEKGFTIERLAEAVTMSRMQQLTWTLVNYTNSQKAKWFKNSAWNFPENVLSEAAKMQQLGKEWLNDAWGNPIKLIMRDKKLHNQTGWDQYDFHELVSAGPDGKFGTDDDVGMFDTKKLSLLQAGWFGNNERLFTGLGGRRDMLRKGGFGGGIAERALPMAAAAPGMAKNGAILDQMADMKKDGGVSAPTRIREYFPETMLWQPTLITDDKGVAVLPVNFADSITTWRLTASASTKGGALGGIATPLRVFQDFFVDIDLPVALTQNDQVSFPVAVYNYLKTPQTVKLDLKEEPWFDLTEGSYSRSLDLKPNEVTSVKFHIRARKIGFHPLTVKASGSKMSDAIKRSIEIVPDGQRVEHAVTDRLSGPVKQTITIPPDALPDASKLIVKIYPGVMSQVLEGTDGMLRMPHGCFEQTSSCAYPNILVVDYVKKARVASPELLMKAEQFLNVGYQRLLTFERPGGGFDWWGSGEPLVWLSAYGLQEFNDMAKVYPIDRGVIDRTQQWLLKQQDADGTWSKIGATHGETIERMGDAKLLLTSYVAWSLFDSGLRVPQLEKSIAYIRKHLGDAKDNAYILALAANALAAHDPKDDSTLEALQKLDKLRKDMPEWKAICFPVAGQSLSYARGDCATVETTALAVLAMLKTGQFTNSINDALTYLVKSKNAGGTWGSTQATILALKALVAAAGGPKQEGKAEFVVRVNGKEAATGAITPENADVMQLFDLKEHTKIGDNDVSIEVKGTTNLMYQIVGRHYEMWKPTAATKPVLDVTVDYDRTNLSTSDLLRAKATMKYHGDLPTYMVIVDLGIPPGFTVDAGDFAEMVVKNGVQKFSVTARQVTLYLGDVKPGDVKTFEYTLKPKYPIKAKTPASVVYEYNAPSNRGTSAPVELTVVDKK